MDKSSALKPEDIAAYCSYANRLFTQTVVKYRMTAEQVELLRAAAFFNATLYQSRFNPKRSIVVGFRTAVKEVVAGDKFARSDCETMSIDQLMLPEEQEDQKDVSTSVCKKCQLGLRLITWTASGRELQTCYSGEVGDWVHPSPVRHRAERGLGGKTPR